LSPKDSVICLLHDQDDAAAPELQAWKGKRPIVR
jgi:hypothetical protein